MTEKARTVTQSEATPENAKYCATALVKTLPKPSQNEVERGRDLSRSSSHQHFWEKVTHTRLHAERKSAIKENAGCIVH